MTTGARPRALLELEGMPFIKMTGSGNDFVFFDARQVQTDALTQPHAIGAICNRNNGIGADGIVILEPLGGSGGARILYFNRDGSAADLCGNATLCSATLSAHLGLASPMGMTLQTPAGAISARVVNGKPEIRMPTVTALTSAANIPVEVREQRIGFANVGIPHLVVLCDKAQDADLELRGPVLRQHPWSGAAGANVNWVAPMEAGIWRYRTFERGVEGETLACGTGAVATAAVLAAWQMVDREVTLRTSSGRDLVVTLEVLDGQTVATLSGEGRIVFSGHISTLLNH